MLLSPRPFESRLGGRLRVMNPELRPPLVAIHSVRDTAHTFASYGSREREISRKLPFRQPHGAFTVVSLRVRWLPLYGLWHTTSRWTIPIDPQQPTGLVFVLLGDHLPALISQQSDKEPTRRIPHPPRIHRRSCHVAAEPLRRLAPAARDRIADAGRADGPHRQGRQGSRCARLAVSCGSARGYRLGEAYGEPWGRMVVGSLALALAVARPL